MKDIVRTSSTAWIIDLCKLIRAWYQDKILIWYWQKVGHSIKDTQVQKASIKCLCTNVLVFQIIYLLKYNTVWYIFDGVLFDNSFLKTPCWF